MASQTRKAAADTELGRRHPYATLYGGAIAGLVALLVMVALLAALWSNRPDWNWSGPDGGSRLVLLIGLLAPVTIALLWIRFSPSHRQARQIRKLTRGL